MTPIKKLLIFCIIFLLQQYSLADDVIPGFISGILIDVFPKIDCPETLDNHKKLYHSQLKYAEDLSGFSNAEISSCYQEAYEKADFELKKVYQNLLEYYEKLDLQHNKMQLWKIKSQCANKLKQAQSYWIKHKNAQCELIYHSFYGGNAAGLNETLCHFSLTKARIEELKKIKIFEDN